MIVSSYRTDICPIYDWVVSVGRRWNESDSGQKLDNMLELLEWEIQKNIATELMDDRVANT